MEVELRLMEVKESLRKAEAGPFTLGTTLDSSLQDAPAVSMLASCGALFILSMKIITKYIRQGKPLFICMEK